MNIRATFVVLVTLAWVGTASGQDWTEVTGPGPGVRAGFVMETIQGDIYLHGGWGSEGPLGDLWRWGGSSWEQLTPAGPTPVPRFLHSGTTDGRYLYVLLGQDAAYEYLEDVWRYDPQANTWEELTAESPGEVHEQAPSRVEVGRSRANVTIMDDEITTLPVSTLRDLPSIVVIGGQNGSTMTTDSVVRYDLGSLEFKEAGQAPVDLAGHNVARQPDGTAIVFNGSSSGGVNNLLWRMRLRNGVLGFTQLQYEQPGPPVGEAAAAFHYGGDTYVGGGWRDFQLLNGWWKLDCSDALTAGSTCSWSSLGTLPHGNWEHGLGWWVDHQQNENLKVLTYGGSTAQYGQYGDTWQYITQDVVNHRPVDFALPSVAAVKGWGGVEYTTRFTASNWCSFPIRVGATYTPRMDLGGPQLTSSFTVSPGVLYQTDRPFEDLFGLDPSATAVGSWLLDVDGPYPECFFGQVVITANNPDGRQFGQYFPAIRWDRFTRPGDIIRIPMTEDGSLNRVNFGAMATADDSRFTVRTFGSEGTELGSLGEYTLDRGENFQINGIYPRMGFAYDVKASTEIEVNRGGSGIFYNSGLDGQGSYSGTSDPTTRLWTGAADRLIFPEVGTVTGLNNYTGGITIINLEQDDADVEARFFERGTPGLSATNSFRVPGRGSMTFTDASRDLFQKDVVGTIEIFTPDGSLTGSGREFAVYKDARGKVVGTAGQSVLGRTPKRAFYPSSTYRFLDLRQTGTGPGSWRSHASFFNPGPGSSVVTISLYDGSTGTHEGDQSWTVRPEELARVNFIISAVNPSHDDDRPKWLQVKVTNPVFGSAYNVNEDGDPVTLEAFRSP